MDQQQDSGPPVTFKDAAHANPPPPQKESPTEKNSDHLEKNISPMYNKHLARIQQSVSKGNEKCDNPEGAESSHHYEENYCSPDSKLLLSSPKKSCPKKSIGNLDQHPHP